MSANGDGRRLRVLALARSYPNNVFGTLGLWTERPARQLARSCEVRVISPVPYCPALPRRGRLTQYTRFRDVFAEETRGGIRVYHPRFLVGPADSTIALDAAAYRLAARPLVDRMREEFPFDLIHAHFVHPDGVVARALARRYGVPFVITDQAPWYPWLERSSVRRAALAAAREASALTAVSGYLRDTILHYLPDARVEVIPNGVEGGEFELPRPGERRPKQIAFVGFLNFNKGVDILLDAMKDVVASEPEARLVLVGGSFYRKTRIEEDELRRRADPLVRSGHVEFLGRRPPEDVARVMRESSVLVLPSKAETFGAVLVEALACGTPVVATRSGGPEDIVTPELGRLVDYGDPAALAAALLDVLRAPERYPPERLREHALREWDWTRIADRYLDLYRRLLGETVTPGSARVYGALRTS